MGIKFEFEIQKSLRDKVVAMLLYNFKRDEKRRQRRLRYYLACSCRNFFPSTRSCVKKKEARTRGRVVAHTPLLFMSCIVVVLLLLRLSFGIFLTGSCEREWVG